MGEIDFPNKNPSKDELDTISKDEFKFYLNSHLQLAEFQKTLEITHGKIWGALDTQQAAGSPAHYKTMESVLEGDRSIREGWLFSVLKELKNLLPADASGSRHLLELNSLIVDAMKFIQTTYVDRDSLYNVPNADKLTFMLQKITNAIDDIRTLAETRLISLTGENNLTLGY